MQPKFAVLYCALAAAWLSPAAAQQSARSHPADPAVAVPAVTYTSAFTGYQPLGTEKTGPWRELNDEVGRAGGHVGILRGSGTASATGKAASHAGHKPEPAQ
jgi:hypothetical protein